MRNLPSRFGLVLVLIGFASVLQAQLRDQLTVAVLFGEATPPLVQNRYFLPVGEHAGARHALSGTLHFSETRMITGHPDSDWKGSGRKRLPGFLDPCRTSPRPFRPSRARHHLLGRARGQLLEHHRVAGKSMGGNVRQRLLTSFVSLRSHRQQDRPSPQRCRDFCL